MPGHYHNTVRIYLPGHVGFSKILKTYVYRLASLSVACHQTLGTRLQGDEQFMNLSDVTILDCVMHRNESYTEEMLEATAYDFVYESSKSCVFVNSDGQSKLITA